MDNEETMSELLRFIISNFSFLYDEFGARFVDSRARGGDALIILELPEVRLRFARDRRQFELDFQHSHRTPVDDWFSFDIVRQLITGTIQDDAIIDAANAEFVKANMGKIVEAFSKSQHKATEKILHEYEKARAKRLFG